MLWKGESDISVGLTRTGCPHQALFWIQMSDDKERL